MDTVINRVPSGDVLEMLFSDRNKAYGAYPLRRNYPKNLGRALGVGFLLIGAFLIFSSMDKSAFFETEKPFDVTTIVSDDIVVDPDKVIPPPIEIPPPPEPVRATTSYLPPRIVENSNPAEEAHQDVEQILESNKDVGAKEVEGTDEALPVVEPNEQELRAVEEVRPAPEKEDSIATFVEMMPSFPGGPEEMMRYIAQNYKIPPLAKETGITGRAVVSFVVNKDGGLEDIRLLKDPGGGCGKEAIRVVSTMPKWFAGQQNGKKVRVRFTLPILVEIR